MASSSSRPERGEEPEALHGMSRPAAGVRQADRPAVPVDASRQPSPTAQSQQLDALREVWSKLGHEDPLWAVLSRADKRGGRWDADEFFATGREEIDVQMQMLVGRGWPRERGLALDFGCGAGRVSRALAAHFDHVVGLDVSASMLDTARRLNADMTNLEFRENTSARLEGIGDASVDLVYSMMTLQHIPTALAAGYVEEFFRVLAPGGVAVFQFVAGADDSLRGWLFARLSNRWLNPLRRLAWRRHAVFEMHGIDEPALRSTLARNGHLRLLEALDDTAAGPGWRGWRWYVVNDDEVPVEVDAGEHLLFVRAGDAHIGAPLIAGVAHEPHVEAALRAHLGPGAHFLDIGANIGVFTMLGARLVGAGGRVFAVEPIPGNAALIERACRRNGFEHVQVMRAAASDREGALELRTEASTSNAATPAAAGPRLLAESGASITVKAIVLDEALAGIERLDLVKIDIEGMEPRALLGLSRTLERWRPVLVCEFHPWAIERAGATTPRAFLDWLGQWYGTFRVLRREGGVEDCHGPEGVMDAWRRVNEGDGGEGRVHLDLLLLPRASD